MISERGPHETIFFSDGHLVTQKIVDGVDVTLRFGGQDIFVRAVKVLGPDFYSGTIDSFDPSDPIKSNDLKLGQAIEFRERNIFGVHGG